eukprot:1853461-Amphidinium_carterae.1
MKGRNPCCVLMTLNVSGGCAPFYWTLIGAYWKAADEHLTDAVIAIEELLQALSPRNLILFLFLCVWNGR